jgi:predicted lipoprotein
MKLALKKTSFATLSFLIVGAILIGACKKDDPDDQVDPESFNKGLLLTNLADNYILPALNDFSLKISTLETSYVAFQNNRTQLNLEITQEAWKEAYLSWQSLKIFDFGPIRDNGFKGATGTYPTDTAKINNNISSGSYNLATAGNVDAIGLPALDYLLFRVDALNYFIGDDAYATYGWDVIQKISSETGNIIASWGSYRATFVASTGTESTSAFSQLVNEYTRDYELAKNAKLGIPIGKQSLGIQLPEYIEARRSGFSFELLRKSMVSLTAVFNGNSFDGGNGGIGFDDYLTQLERSTLSSTINTRFSQILTKIDTFSGTLEQEMATSVSELDELYNLIQGQVVNIKTDMASAFGVLITYQDNDGD